MNLPIREYVDGNHVSYPALIRRLMRYQAFVALYGYSQMGACVVDVPGDYRISVCHSRLEGVRDCVRVAVYRAETGETLQRFYFFPHEWRVFVEIYDFDKDVLKWEGY